MNFLVNVYASATAPATPTGDAAREIGPGFLGFVFTAFIAIAAILLLKDMTRRIRRVRYEAEATTRQRELVERGERDRAESGLYDDDDASRPASGSDSGEPGKGKPSDGPDETDGKHKNLWG